MDIQENLHEEQFGDDYRDKQIDFAECLWRARLRQADAARLLDCTKQQFNDWYSGKTYPKKHWERTLKRFFLDRGVKIAYKSQLK